MRAALGAVAPEPDRHAARPAGDEFRTSLDAFPLEYGEIIRAHQRVFGNDPFDGVAIAAADLRRACETQIKSHLVHLREGFIEAGGEPSDIADSLPRPRRRSPRCSATWRG